MTIKEQIAKIEKTINEEYADISEYKELIRKQTAKEILGELKSTLVNRFDYFGQLRNKNLQVGSNDNALFDLGEMDCINFALDRIKELADYHGIELE